MSISLFQQYVGVFPSFPPRFLIAYECRESMGISDNLGVGFS